MFSKLWLKFWNNLGGKNKVPLMPHDWHNQKEMWETYYGNVIQKIAWKSILPIRIAFAVSVPLFKPYEAIKNEIVCEKYRCIMAKVSQGRRKSMPENLALRCEYLDQSSACLEFYPNLGF